MSDFQLGQRVTFTHVLYRRARPTRGHRVNGMTVDEEKTWTPMSVGETPMVGVIVGRRTLSNGHVRWGYEEGSVYVRGEHFPAYIVAYDLNRKLEYVQPHNLTPAP